MTDTRPQLAFIGFGEAAMAFHKGWGPAVDALVRAYDKKTADPALRDAKLADYARFGAEGRDTLGEAVSGMPLILSVVTADEALDAAREAARHIAPGALYCDMNSIAPATKQAAAEAVEAAGGRYVDVAVMAPVHPPLNKVPVLGSGPHVAAAAAALAEFGFTLDDAGNKVGRASSIKMIRSAMVKGIEALSAECGLAAHRAGVADEVIASLDASMRHDGWAAKMEYDLGRMMQHGLRRAAEMEEVVKTLDGLGTGSQMSRGSVERHRAIGRLGLPPEGDLAARCAAILERSARAA